MICVRVCGENVKWKDQFNHSFLVSDGYSELMKNVFHGLRNGGIMLHYLLFIQHCPDIPALQIHTFVL